MSVTSAMFAGVSGLLANAEGINVIGNNLANVNTVGFKSARMLFSDVLSANIGNDSQIGTGTQIQKVDNVFGQGTFETTESVTDIALRGSSFFALGPPAGNAQVTSQNLAFLSRAGAFRMDSTLHLVNPDGYQVLDTNGDPIQFNDSGTIPPTAGDFSKITKIDSNGAITYQDKLGNAYFYNTAGAVGLTTFTPGTNRVIAVVNAPNPGGLSKAGGTLFQAGANSGVTANVFSNAASSPNIANGVSDRIYSNSLEQSNVDMAGQFVKMILTQRAYSANSKTITTADEMTQEALNLKR
ncbi:MAG: flagellar hook-basal body complex protein [Geobacteraceae bacterium]|nr:flagellar hook-basal body complex protein [Geobacteraceae bacterium]NTW78961.1 flagellar hook-basal body complex protein [Geobacteraceae bacterium]